MRMLPCAVALVLAACGTAAPAPDLPYIEISNTGSIHGFDILRVYRDDRVMRQSLDGAPPAPRPDYSAGRPGLYVELAARVAAEGPALAGRPPGEICPDFGTTLVAAVPPVGGFAQAAASCPDPALDALAAGLLALVEGDAP